MSFAAASTEPSDYSCSQITIKRVAAETEWVDVMGGSARLEVDVHDHGLVALVDCMPRLVPRGQTADYAIVQAARVSYGEGTKRVNEDRGLIRYLARHRHTTPFEMVRFKFHCRMPIFVARQWIRHRTASVNEYSARYSVVKDLFYRPTAENIRLQSASNRQGGSDQADDMTAEQFLEYLDRAEKSYADYESLLEKGLSREQARMGLPLNTYTEWYWLSDLHNTMHFLSLRMDAHAQQEIRDYAYAMFALIKDIVPVAAEAFIDYRMEGMYLTRLEVDALRSGSEKLATENKREQQEWTAKMEKLGLKHATSTSTSTKKREVGSTSKSDQAAEAETVGDSSSAVVESADAPPATSVAIAQ